MTDTNHIEVLREMRESWTELGSKAYDKYVAACDAAITTLSARASAGEGGPCFADAEALATWLESLHECNDDGAVTGNKWEPAQKAAAAIRTQTLPVSVHGTWIDVPIRVQLYITGLLEKLAATPKPEGGGDEHVRLLVGKLDQWRMCMSHNESYFGEPAGLVKATIAELAKAVDPIYPPKPEPVDPLARVAIYTATVPLTAAPQPAQAGASGGGDGLSSIRKRLRNRIAENAGALKGSWNHWRAETFQQVLDDIEFATPASPAAVQEPQWVGWLRNDVEDEEALAAAPQPQHCPKCQFTMSGIDHCVNCATPPAHGDGEGGPDSASFKEGFSVGRAESEMMCELLRGPKCSRCGARNAIEAETLCRPSEDSCPGSEWPLSNIWALTTRPTPEAQEARDVRPTMRELIDVLPGVYYMDPPDGGSVSLLEQLQRMAKDAARYRWLRERWGRISETYMGESSQMESIGDDEDGWEVDPTSLDDCIDAALALPAQGEGNNG